MSYLYHYTLMEHVPEGDIPLGVVHMLPGQSRNKRFHDHNHSEIVLILGGSAIHLLNGQSIQIQAGDLLVIHPGDTHAYDQVATLELVNIIYNAHKLYLPILDGAKMPLFRIFFPDESRQEAYDAAHPVLQLTPDEMDKISGMIRDLDQELTAKLPGYNLNSLAMFIQLVVKLCRLDCRRAASEKIPFQIGNAIEYMNAHYPQPIFIAQMAHDMCMSRRNFFLQFKKATSCSPVQYLTKLRISRAIELLLHSEMRISDIAEKCGFSDSNYFCKVFRQETGLPPRQFRQKNGK